MLSVRRKNLERIPYDLIMHYATNIKRVSQYRGRATSDTIVRMGNVQCDAANMDPKSPLRG